MLRRNQYLQDRQSPLLNLPDDVLILILKLAKKQNLREIARVSRRFHHIVNSVFRNTLYARSLQFERWQKEKVFALQKSVDDFIRHNEASLLNWPDINVTINSYLFAKIHLYALAILAIVFFLTTSITNFFTLNFLESAGVGGLVTLIALAGLAKLYLRITRERRDAYHHSTIGQIHLDQLIALLNAHHEIIAEKPVALNLRQLNVTTLNNFINALQSDVNLIAQASSQVAEFLIEASRFSSNKKFEVKDFDKLNEHGNKDYALNLCLLWNERHRGNEIVEINEMDSIPRSPNVSSYGTF